MQFSTLAGVYEEMTHTSSRTELTNLLVKILKKTPSDEIGKVANMTQGKLYPDFLGIEIGMAEKTVAKAIEKAYGSDEKEVRDLLRSTGDLGDVTAKLCENRSQQSFVTENLTLDKVFTTFDEIARTSGQGSSEVRLGKLVMLLISASPLEAKFLVRFVTGKLRLGVADFTVLDALAIAFTESKANREKLENAYNLTSDLSYVATLLEKKGIRAIEKVRAIPGNPIRPMLAERMESGEQIIEKMGGKASADYKLDGERVQAHRKSTGEITLFSRRLEQITDQYSDVVKALDSVPSKEFILEGEIVAIDSQGKYLPFQELMHRRRKYELEEAQKKYPVRLNLFDVLYLNGEETLEEPYETRRKVLEKLFQSKALDKETIRLVKSMRMTSGEQIDSFMEESLAAGCEGLVVKDLASPYKAGARGFAWIKFKPEYKPGVRDTVDLVIVGADHGMGRRAGVYGAFLLAAYDDGADIFRTTTKIGTGFSDEDLEKFTKLLDKHKIPERGPRVDSKAPAEVWFEPKIVIEILAAEITLSPIYTAGLDLVRPGSGFALRFPKFMGKIRDDKAPEDASTVKELLEMYQSQTKQFKKGT
jgi:DNA ligase 1